MRHFLNKNAFFQRSLAHVMSGFTLVLRFSRGEETGNSNCDAAHGTKRSGTSRKLARPFLRQSAEGVLSPNAYQRGLFYLANHQGKEAATEFQSILDHPGLVGNLPGGALAHLQMARAYAMQGDTAKAKAAYQDFLTLWKDADPDIPILKQGKAEHAKLQ